MNTSISDPFKYFEAKDLSKSCLKTLRMLCPHLITLSSVHIHRSISFVSIHPSVHLSYDVCLILMFKNQHTALKRRNTRTHAHPFNGPFTGTTRVSRYQKGKPNLDFTEARDSEWQWHQLGHMQVCISPAPTTQFFTGRMPFLPPKQQRQSTEGSSTEGREETT